MPKALQIQGTQFLDDQGRTVHLRGVNLSGSTKTPRDEPSHIANTFSRHREVSFVGRPFSLEDAEEHFLRLEHWGFNTLRFLTTWEAIEHAGRGQYDEAYLDYFAEVVALAGEYDFYVLIDPHQDVWSRMTGGDGAPGWTLEAAGFDISRLDASEAAITMQRRYPDYPTMVWVDNYSRLACATMFTLFFAGDRFAPNLRVDGIPIQSYLQDAFIAAMEQVAKRLKNMPHVLGYGPLNEPGKGFIGLPSLYQYNGFPPGLVEVSALNAMAAGGGMTVEAPLVSFDQNFNRYVGHAGTATLNPDGISAWMGNDLWWDLGVWGVEGGKPVALHDDYFADADFLEDGLLPFTQKYADAILAIDPDVMFFMETVPTETHRLRLIDAPPGRVVNAGHWYDAFMLFSRRFDGNHGLDYATGVIVEGRENVQKLFNDGIGSLVNTSVEVLDGVPTLVGEFGLSYDINDQYGLRTEDFSAHELALSMYYDAIDMHLVHSTQWNYTPDNSNRWGDNWNGEDLSIFSRDQQFDEFNLDSGGRAVRGFCRPHVQVAAGTLQKQRFDHETADFEAEIDCGGSGETLIYVPAIWYGYDHQVKVSSGEWRETDDPQILVWTCDQPGRQTIRIAAGSGD